MAGKVHTPLPSGKMPLGQFVQQLNPQGMTPQQIQNAAFNYAASQIAAGNAGNKGGK